MSVVWVALASAGNFLPAVSTLPVAGPRGGVATVALTEISLT